VTSADSLEVAAHWDNNPWNTEEVVYWTQLPSIQQRLALKESGRPGGNWVDYTLETYLADRLPLAHCLSLGCGRGGTERRWAERGAFRSCDAYDISPVSIADAEVQAARAGLKNIRYSVADIDHIELPGQRYDAAWTVDSAHHFSRLEHVFAQVAHALKPEGLFVLHEYVGASRFQFGRRQREVIQACLNLLPVEYRSLTHSPQEDDSESSAALARRGIGNAIHRALDEIRRGTFRSTVARHWRKRQAIQEGHSPIKEEPVPNLHSVMAVDPSEAIRSAEIVPVLKSHFDIDECRPLGGSILQFLLADIAGNFLTDDGERLLAMLFTIEDTLSDLGDLPSDFAYIVARPR